LGSTVRNFGGNSEIHIEAGEQIRLGRDLMAGKLIDVRGGNSQHQVGDPAPVPDLYLYGDGDAYATADHDN
jgi:hypothetical protein